ncbi:MAG: hypothetical protein K9H12_03830 [Bacteroidales bacterium]|nr:hypothetical protein [Bacteroidales bacterium]
MKINRRYLISILIAILTISGFSQSNENLNKKIYFSLYGGYGYINPDNINEQLDIYADNAGIEFYKNDNPHINIAYIFGTGINYFVVKNLEIKSDIEFAWAHKQIKVLLYSDYWNDLIRLSGGLYGNYHYFLANSNSFYLGGGLNYNNLILSAFNKGISGKSTPLGYSMQIGYLAYIGNSKNKRGQVEYFVYTENSKNNRRQVFCELEYNLVKGENKEYQEVSELSFTGISLKFGFNL